MQKIPAAAAATRRDFLKTTAFSAAALAGGALWAGCRRDPAGDGTDAAASDGAAASDARASDAAAWDSATPACLETDPDQLGPYYRAGAPFRSALNVLGAPGTPLVLRGTVYGLGCSVGLAGALLDLWQADDTGAYDNTTADFQLRGQLYADGNGWYELSTIYPGLYEVAPGAFRPHHIHAIVTAAGFVSLTTQIYFAMDPLAPGGAAFDTLVVPLVTAADGSLSGTFDIVLRPA